MIVYNVTIKISWKIHDDWLSWLKNIHIPEVIDTGCFTHYTILRLLEVDETDGPTYTVQYFVKSKALYNNYIENFAAVLREKGYQQWGDQFVAFRSVMQIVQ